MAANDANERKQPLSKLQSISKRFLNAYFIVNVLVLSSYLVCARTRFEQIWGTRTKNDTRHIQHTNLLPTLQMQIVRHISPSPVLQKHDFYDGLTRVWSHAIHHIE